MALRSALRACAALALVVSGCTTDAPSGGAAGLRPLDVAGGPLAPGTYATQDFSEPFTFEVGTETWIVRQEEPTIVTLTAPRTELAFATPRRVYEKVPDRFVPRLRPPPRDFVTWLTTRPDLETGDPSRARVAGRVATAIDVKILELYEEAELLGCPLPCLPLAPGGTAEPLFLTHTHRMFVLDGGRPLVIVYSTGNRRGERAARALLETVRFVDVSAP